MNKVYIGASIDGYIADKNDGLDWLDMVPNPDNEDMGYFEFFNGIDALVMGRKTFETVLGFDVPWPYEKPVFVLSSSLKEVPASLTDKAFLLNGALMEVLEHIHSEGYKNLYIDGGTTISNFLKEDLIDELTISTIPIVLGGGAPLFSKLPKQLEFELVSTKTLLNQITQIHFRRRR